MHGVCGILLIALNLSLPALKAGEVLSISTEIYPKKYFSLRDLSRNNISSLPDGVFATLKYLRRL